MLIKTIYKLVILNMLFSSSIASGQSSIKGNVYFYNSKVNPVGITVVIVNIQTKRYLTGDMTDSSGIFKIESNLNGIFNL